MSTVRLANLKSGGLDLIERALATDIKDISADPKLKLVDRARARLPGHDINLGNGEQAKNPLGKDAKVRQALEPRDRPRGAEPGRVQRRVRARQPVGQSRAPLLPEELPGPEARRRQGQDAAEGGRRHHAVRRRLHGAEQRRDAGRSPK